MLWMVVLPQQLSKRIRGFNIKLERPYPFNDKKFFIVKKPESIIVHAMVTEQEYKDLIGTVTAEVDLSEASSGTHSYPVSISPSRFQKLVREGIPTAVYTLEPVIQTKVPVVVTSTGKLSDQSLLLDDLKFATREVEVNGPKSAVSAVSRAQATLRLDMVDVKAPQSMDVSLEPFDSDNHIVANVDIRPAQVTITPKLSPSPKNQTVFVEAKFVGKVPDGYIVKNYTVEPDRVLVSGPSRLVTGMTKVFTEPIDVSQLTSTQTLTVLLQTPPEQTSYDAKEVKVTIYIEPVSIKNLNPVAVPKVGGVHTPASGSSKGP